MHMPIANAMPIVHTIEVVLMCVVNTHACMVSPFDWCQHGTLVCWCIGALHNSPQWTVHWTCLV